MNGRTARMLRKRASNEARNIATRMMKQKHTGQEQWTGYPRLYRQLKQIWYTLTAKERRQSAKGSGRDIATINEQEE